MKDVLVRRLGRGDVVAARQAFEMMAKLMNELRERALASGIRDVFVPADNEDSRALDFYRALGGVELPVTHFTFTAP